MTAECQLDSIQIVKLIYDIKKILIKLIKKNKNKKEYFSKLYENCIKNISLNNYFEYIAGTFFSDKI